MEHDRSVWPQEVQAAASLSPGPKGNTVYVDKARGYPFCEFEVVEGRPPDLIVQIYNTSEVDPGRCEPARFDSIDPQALAKQVGADAVVMNPRRFWRMDRLWSYDAGETYDFDGVKATWMGKLELKNVKLGEHGKPFPVYKESEITRHSKYDLYFSPLVTMDVTRRQLTNLKLGKDKVGISMHNRTGNSTQGHLTLTFPCQSPEVPSALRRTIATIVPCLFAMVVAAGCASTTVTDRQQLVTGQLPRPEHIWVSNFAATAADVPADSTLAGQYAAGATPQTAEQIATGRQLGAQIAAELVEEIRGMGLPAARAVAGTIPRINDLVIRGYLLSVKEGSAAERIAIGFGSGASELRTAVEGYQMTPQGLRELGAGTVESGGSKTPGAALGVAGLIATGNPAGLIISTGMKVYGEESGRSTVEGRAKQTAKEIADVLKKRFQQQGWIN